MMRTSDTISKLTTALAHAQAKFRAAKKSRASHHGAYSDMNDLWSVAREPLCAHGLSVVQIPSGDVDRLTLTTRLLHESGEWIEDSWTRALAPNATAQQAGSLITYMRRYAFGAVTGITSAEDDDDGNEASAPTPTHQQHQHARSKPAERPAAAPPPPTYDQSNDEDAQKLIQFLNEHCPQAFPYWDLLTERLHGLYFTPTSINTVLGQVAPELNAPKA